MSFRYGLVGPNGHGKTTLLRHIGSRWAIGDQIPVCACFLYLPSHFRNDTHESAVIGPFGPFSDASFYKLREVSLIILMCIHTFSTLTQVAPNSAQHRRAVLWARSGGHRWQRPGNCVDGRHQADRTPQGVQRFGKGTREDEEREAKEKKTEAQNEKKGLDLKIGSHQVR